LCVRSVERHFSAPFVTSEVLVPIENLSLTTPEFENQAIFRPGLNFGEGQDPNPGIDREGNKAKEVI
jgi:hypothetical protein